MAVRKMQVNDRSTLAVGLPTEFDEVIAQYVWNAFEAKATTVRIDYDESNPIDNLQSFTISDDGLGIAYEELDQNFGIFLDSTKIRSKNSSLIHGGKGKGRLSFQLFSGNAVWNTVYQHKDGSLKEYSISILKGTKDDYNPTIPVPSTQQKTGTIVELKLLEKVTKAYFDNGDLAQSLKLKFGWFLHLNKDKKISILINGETLDYKTIIKESKHAVKSFEDEDDNNRSYKFVIDYIQWNEKIGEQNYYYFLNSDQDEIFKDFTSFNKTAGGAHGFYHGVYITSDFFNNFDAKSDTHNQTSMLSICKSNSAYKALLVYLKDDLLKKRKEFYKESAAKAWQGFEERHTVPEYGNSELQKIRKESLKQVVEGLYKIEPGIFVNLKPEQEKTMLGLMDLVIDTNEKDNVIKIVDSVVNDLSPEEREEFAKLLDKIKLSSINEVLKLVVGREKVIEALKKLVFELKKFTNERDHIQKAVEGSTWLFGEEFTTVSYDKTFEESLREYTYILDGYSAKDILTDPSKKRRMDIFMTRKRLINDPHYGNTSQLEENIIIELKRPNVKLGTTELRQVQDYRNIIKKNSQFHSQMKVWKFFLVGNDLDDDIKAAYKTNDTRGKRFLADWQEDFEIYVMTWADVFDVYRIRNDFLLNKLNIDKSTIQDELKVLSAEKPSEDLPNEITEVIQTEALVAV